MKDLVVIDAFICIKSHMEPIEPECLTHGIIPMIFAYSKPECIKYSMDTGFLTREAILQHLRVFKFNSSPVFTRDKLRPYLMYIMNTFLSKPTIVMTGIVADLMDESDFLTFLSACSKDSNMIDAIKGDSSCKSVVLNIISNIPDKSVISPIIMATVLDSEDLIEFICNQPLCDLHSNLSVTLMRAKEENLKELEAYIYDNIQEICQPMTFDHMYGLLIKYLNDTGIPEQCLIALITHAEFKEGICSYIAIDCSLFSAIMDKYEELHGERFILDDGASLMLCINNKLRYNKSLLESSLAENLSHRVRQYLSRDDFDICEYVRNYIDSRSNGTTILKQSFKCKYVSVYKELANHMARDPALH